MENMYSFNFVKILIHQEGILVLLDEVTQYVSVGLAERAPQPREAEHHQTYQQAAQPAQVKSQFKY